MPSGLLSDQKLYRPAVRPDPAEALLTRLSGLILRGCTADQAAMEIEVTVAEWRSSSTTSQRIEIRLDRLRAELEAGQEVAENAIDEMEPGAARHRAETGLVAIRAALRACG